MHRSTFHPRRLIHAALVLAAATAAVRAADDVVREDEPVPPAEAPQALPFGGQFQGGRVIIMPGLRLQMGGQGQVQVQGNAAAAGAAADAAGEKQPYLGVVASPVAAPVRAQLDLPEGVGVSVDAVAAGGPAEKAGVRPFDVIHKFNDQVIVSPEQLTTLVKVAGAGTRVPLTLRRGGREKVVEAVLEEHEVSADGAEGFVQGMPGVLNLEQMMPPGFGGGAVGPQMQAEIERKLAEALARAGARGGLLPGFAPGMMPGMVPGVAGNVRAQVLTIGPNAQSATVVSDARGTVEIRSAGGKKTVTVKDPQGEEVHSGPLDTDEDFEKVPEDYRDWVREVDGGGPAVVEEPLEEPEQENPDADPAADERPAARSAGDTTI